MEQRDFSPAWIQTTQLQLPTRTSSILENLHLERAFKAHLYPYNEASLLQIRSTSQKIRQDFISLVSMFFIWNSSVLLQQRYYTTVIIYNKVILNYQSP